MKKSLFLGVMGLWPIFALAQTPLENVTASQQVNHPSFEEEFFSAIDMKIFHDRQIVQNAILQMAEQQNSPMTAADGTRDKITQGVFNEKDSEILETTMDNKRVVYTVTPELWEKAGEEPFEAFKDLIKSATIPKLTPQELEQLNQVDDKAIPQMLQMTTDAGSDIGARPVSVMYGNEI